MRAVVVLALVVALAGCAEAHGAPELDARRASDAGDGAPDARDTADAASADAASADAASADAASADAGPPLGLVITLRCDADAGASSASFTLAIRPDDPTCDAAVGGALLEMTVQDRLGPWTPVGRTYHLGEPPSDGTARHCADASDPATCIALSGTLVIDAVSTGPVALHYDLAGADGVHRGMQPGPYVWCGMDCPGPGI